MTEPNATQCPIIWCDRDGPHPLHNRLLYETRGWHGQIITLCLNQVLDQEPTLRLYLHDSDTADVAESESYTRDQATHLARVLNGLEPAQTIALLGTIGAAVSLMDGDREGVAAR